jgi:uncharacterized membrane protein YjgN (DUF898 family)
VLLIAGGVALAFMAGICGAATGIKPPFILAAVVLLIYFGLFFVFAYIRVRTTNSLWNALKIGPMRFESALRARDVTWLYFSNLLAIVLTLGLATPWAVVRAMRYRASMTTVIVSGSLDGFAQAEAQQVSVAGEEAAELFDIDIAL